VPVEGAGRHEDAPIAPQRQADKLGGLKDVVQEAGEIEGTLDQPKAWVVHARVRVHMSSLVRLAFAKQFTSADRNWRARKENTPPHGSRRVCRTQMQEATFCAGEMC
jgi:hypothetical protein